MKNYKINLVLSAQWVLQNYLYALQMGIIMLVNSFFLNNLLILNSGKNLKFPWPHIVATLDFDIKKQEKIYTKVAQHDLAFSLKVLFWAYNYCLLITLGRWYEKCHVWRHKKKEGWEEKWERKPLKQAKNLDVFLWHHTCHFHYLPLDRDRQLRASFIEIVIV